MEARYELDLASSTIEKLEGRIQELRESPTLGFTTFLDTAQINALQKKIDELSRGRDQTQARISFLEGPPDTGAPATPLAPTPDDTAGVQDRAKNLERIAHELEGTLFSITHEGSARIIAEHERRLAEIEVLRAKDGSNAEAVDQLIAQSAAVRDAQLAQLLAKEVEATEKVRAANERVVASLEAEREALVQTERERFVAQALSRLSAEATAEQRREVEQLAGALFDEQQALQARQRLLDEGRSVINRTRTATEQHAAEIEKLNELLQAGAIDQATYARAVEDANDRALRSSQAWTDGAARFLKDYVAESNDAAAATEQAFANAFRGAEDALVAFIGTGKLEFQSLTDSILADLTRMTVRQTITAPLAGALQSVFAGAGTVGAFHRGGVVGERPPAVRYADAALFEHAPALPRRWLRRVRASAGRGADHRAAWGAGGAARAGRARGEVGTRAAADHGGGQRHCGRCQLLPRQPGTDRGRHGARN
jgi:lambda family phage tail tape measure protein